MVTKRSAAKLREHTELWCYMSQLISDFGIVHGGMYCSIALVIFISSTIFLFLLVMTLILSPEKHIGLAILLPVTFSTSVLMVYSEAAYVALLEVILFIKHYFM